MKRDFEKYLLHWKNSPNRKPLIIRGARQVGKTYTVDRFAEKNYQHYLKINLEQDTHLKSIFESNHPDQIIYDLSALYQVPLKEKESLLFIDEIQVAPEAIKSLRYFHEQKPDLHIITAGSLLDHTLNHIKYSMPVGRVEFAYMYPMTFKEFLMASGENGLVEAMDQFEPQKSFSYAIHKRISELLRLYFFIGGMPEAVASYIQQKDMTEIEKIHSNILTSIEYDFAKYGTRKQQEHLRDVLHYVANHIGKKVKYSQVNKSVNSSVLKDAFLKLELSRIIHLVRHTKSSEVPLTQYQNNDVFKPVFFDIGLVNQLAKIQLTDLDNLVTAYEGALAEQFVCQEFIASQKIFKEQKLHYWIREAKNANAEIDCLMQINNKVYPIEIKSGKRGTLKSLHVFLAEKNKKTGIRFNLDLPSYGKDLTAPVNLPDKKQIQYNLLSLPLYFAYRLYELPLNELDQ